MFHEPGGATPLEVLVGAGNVELAGLLTVPEQSTGIVVFAHGSGSSRFSVRNRAVADHLNGRGLATLLVDLLAQGEHAPSQASDLRFDIGLLGHRLTGAIDWLAEQDRSTGLPLGLFGAGLGAAAAIRAAAARPQAVRAVVCRGGRPDLALDTLDQVQAPTLLIVGELDRPAIEVNEAAAVHLRVEHRVEIVPGASHLFEEPGCLEAVAQRAHDWYRRHLGT